MCIDYEHVTGMLQSAQKRWRRSAEAFGKNGVKGVVMRFMRRNNFSLPNGGNGQSLTLSKN